MYVVTVPFHIISGMLPLDWADTDSMQIRSSDAFGLFWKWEFTHQAAIAQVIQKHSERLGQTVILEDQEMPREDSPVVSVAVRVDPGAGEKIAADLKKYDLVEYRDTHVTKDLPTGRDWVYFCPYGEL